MAPEIRRLKLQDIVRTRRGSLLYRFIILFFGIALHIFFRRIEIVNADRIPSDRGVIFVMNHPNGLIDPGLVFIALPRRIAFLAKSTLFRMPVIGWILRTVGALPLYRRIDAGEDVSKNNETFELSRRLLREGGSIALFPEGVSHNSPKLLPLKSGAARIALGAATESEPVTVVPAGLYYTSKATFRSAAMIHIGDAFEVALVKPDENGQPSRDAVRALTAKIQRALLEVTLNAESEAELHTARIAEEIFSTDDKRDLKQEFEFQQRFLEDRSEIPDSLKRRISEFDVKLGIFGLEPEHLSLAVFSRRSVLRETLRFAWKFVLLSPLAIIGIILHFPAYELCRLFATWYASHGADDVASTAKVLAGVVFMPLTWMVAAGIGWVIFSSFWAVLIVPAGALTGYAALYTLEEFEEARGWAYAIALFMWKRERFLRLFAERRELVSKLR